MSRTSSSPHLRFHRRSLPGFLFLRWRLRRIRNGRGRRRTRRLSRRIPSTVHCKEGICRKAIGPPPASPVLMFLRLLGPPPTYAGRRPRVAPGVLAPKGHIVYRNLDAAVADQHWYTVHRHSCLKQASCERVPESAGVSIGDFWFLQYGLKRPLPASRAALAPWYRGGSADARVFSVPPRPRSPRTPRPLRASAHFFRVFRLTAQEKCDSLLRWSFVDTLSKMSAGAYRGAREKQNGPGIAGLTKNEK